MFVTAPRQFFADPLAAMGFCQGIVFEIGDLVSRFDERLFLSIEVGLEATELSLKRVEVLLLLLKEALFEER